MIKIMDVEGKRANATATKYILAENLPLDGAELMPYMPHNLTINELGKQLLKAATDGNVEEIRTLMSKGAPFTADWLGTSPLHLAAQNNHLEVCEILLRAGMSRDARTKVDRTPLHMAAYEGHLNIVECLLKNGADCDSKDLLHMTPLHWAAQNGHTDIAATLIRYGATTNIINKFDLTPIDIALQINRPDIVHVINLSIRDPIVATEHLALELISENSTESTIDPTIAIQDESNEIEESETDNTHIPFETIMIDAVDSSAEQEISQYEQQTEDALPESIDKTIEAQGNNAFTESMKILQQHGITMLPVDDTNILNSVMESGHSVVLTEAGKQALNSIKSSETNHDLSQYLKTKPKISTIKKKKIITLTPEQYLAMANNGTISSTQTNILKQINGKVINQAHKTNYVKRVVMKKNKVSPISPGVNVSKMQKIDTLHDVESLMEQLQKAQTIIESYKRKLLKSEVEAARYKQQLKIIMEQNKLSTST